MTNKVFKVGASFNVTEFPANVEWIVESQRDLELYSIAGFLDGESNWRTQFGDVRRLLAGYTGRFGLHGPIQATFATYHKEMRAAIVKEFTDMLHLCGELGATHMVIHSPYLSLGAPFPGVLTELITTAPARSILEEIIPVAERVNCVLMMENVFDSRSELQIGLVRSFDTPNLRVSIDVGHAFVMHRWGGAPTPDFWIRQAGSLLGHVHLQDTDGYTDRHWAPGEGSIPWFAVFQALSELEQEPRLILEISAQTMQQGFRFLADKNLVK